MKTIRIIDKKGKTMIANVVRYYMYDNKDYLIYFTNEVESHNRVKLYVVRVHPNFYGMNLTDSEWHKFQKLMRGIIKGYNMDISDIVLEDNLILPVVRSRTFSVKVSYLDVLKGTKSIQVDSMSNRIRDYLSSKVDDVIGDKRINQRYQFETSKIDNPESLSKIMYQHRYNELLKEHKEILKLLRSYEEKINIILKKYE